MLYINSSLGLHLLCKLQNHANNCLLWKTYRFKANIRKWNMSADPIINPHTPKKKSIQVNMHTLDKRVCTKMFLYTFFLAFLCGSLLNIRRGRWRGHFSLMEASTPLCAFHLNTCKSMIVVGMNAVCIKKRLAHKNVYTNPSSKWGKHQNGYKNYLYCKVSSTVLEISTKLLYFRFRFATSGIGQTLYKREDLCF